MTAESPPSPSTTTVKDTWTKHNDASQICASQEASYDIYTSGYRVVLLDRYHGFRNLLSGSRGCIREADYSPRDGRPGGFGSLGVGNIERIRVDSM